MILPTCLLAALVTTSAIYAPDDQVKQVLTLLDADPPVAEVQRAALEYFRVTQSDLSGYRAAARLKGLFPALSGGYDQGQSALTKLSTDQAKWPSPFDARNPQVTDQDDGLSRSFGATLSWDLGTLVFNSDELDAYGLVGIHEDVVKEVTRLYYTRQHNLLVLALDAPTDVRARAALVLRTRELEAMLDAMTGGEWSRLKKKRGA